MASILIADDDPDYLDAFSTGMQVFGHEITTAQNGESALKILSEQRFDIVFLDIVMRGGGAISLIHDIRGMLPSIPIVVISGRVELFETPVFREGFRLADARMKKSASLQQLQSVVTRLLI
ncbi:two-component response regulator [Pseudooceanicola batsensis HTCC2597]|uniref:Two-component response regulator n=1 Tax=Pseudooceanicola batsensis (strain ATCC BAA-863 / DSM 15984 / KCTC 12145 / HTCC2597) TaxID=252305 RepID=A3TU99_PSEBH|nr:response regulator [Pseudooceanicola batsensis]EAQ04095.1 two-component response regulator [Pseudooceanicola batsensis HTCC2597]